MSPLTRLFQGNAGRATVDFISKGFHLRVFAQEGMHDLALNPNSSSVDDPDFLKTPGYSLVKVFLDDHLYLTGLEGVKVDGVLDRDFMHRSRI